MAKIKLILCDIDDTLVHKELHLNEKVIRIIREVQQEGFFLHWQQGACLTGHRTLLRRQG